MNNKIVIDQEGHWYHNHEPIEHPKVLAAFQRGLRRSPDGRYILQIADHWCYVEVTDAPVQVEAIIPLPLSAQIVLQLSDNRREFLRPDTLCLREGVLYCETESNWPARFSRCAQFSLGSLLEEKDGVFFLLLGEKTFTVI